jgi:hypothetical protein
LTDTDTGVFTSYTQLKGNGSANQNTAGTHTTCSQTQYGTVGDFLDPSQPVPPGMNASDQATATFTVGVVVKLK